MSLKIMILRSDATSRRDRGPHKRTHKINNRESKRVGVQESGIGEQTVLTHKLACMSEINRRTDVDPDT